MNKSIETLCVQTGIAPDFLRRSVGSEAPEDSIEDLRQAIETAYQ